MGRPEATLSLVPKPKALSPVVSSASTILISSSPHASRGHAESGHPSSPAGQPAVPGGDGGQTERGQPNHCHIVIRQVSASRNLSHRIILVCGQWKAGDSVLFNLPFQHLAQGPDHRRRLLFRFLKFTKFSPKFTLQKNFFLIMN